MTNELLITPSRTDVVLVHKFGFDPTATDGNHELASTTPKTFRLLAVAGEIDLATADALTSAVSDELSRGRNVALDLSGVEFIDSTGLKVLIVSNSKAAGDGRVFALVDPSPSVLNILRLTGTDQLLETYVRPAGAENGSGAGV